MRRHFHEQVSIIQLILNVLMHCTELRMVIARRSPENVADLRVLVSVKTLYVLISYCSLLVFVPLWMAGTATMISA